MTSHRSDPSRIAGFRWPPPFTNRMSTRVFLHRHQSLAAKTSSPEAEENWAQADLQLLTLSIIRIYRSVGVVMINLVSTVYHIVTTVTFISKTQVPLTNEYLHRLRILKWLKKRIACPIFQCLWLFISGANENAPQMICGAFQVLSLLVNS